MACILVKVRLTENKVNRRQILKTLLASSGFLAAGCASRAQTSSANNFQDWTWVKSQFALDESLAHLNCFLIAAHPKQVKERITYFRDLLDSNPGAAIDSHFFKAEDEVYGALAKYLGLSEEVAGEQIAITNSTTAGLGLIYSMLKVNRGDEILTTDYEHYSAKKALSFLEERTGAKVVPIRFGQDLSKISENEIVETIVKHVTSKTKVVALTHVLGGLGLKLPVGEIGRSLSRINTERAEKILFCVDGVHGFGVENYSVESLECDFLIAGCHKWLFGPRGTGFVYGKPSAWDRIYPVVPSFSDFIRKGKGRSATPGGFHAFENRWALPSSVDFHLKIGKDRVASRIYELNSALKNGLCSINNVRLITPLSTALSAGITCFEIKGLDASKAVGAYLKENIVAATTAPYRPSYIRMSPGLWNSMEEIKKVIKITETLAKA